MYEFRNRQNRTMVAQAFPSYAPNVAMAHFKKLECFCFTKQSFAAHEKRRMPVVFVVDQEPGVVVVDLPEGLLDL